MEIGLIQSREDFLVCATSTYARIIKNHCFRLRPKIRTDINRAPAGVEGCIIFEGREKWVRAHAQRQSECMDMNRRKYYVARERVISLSERGRRGR